MTTPAGDHLDLDELAELDADVLDPDTAARARAHLASCPRCREEAGRVQLTRGLLASLPAEPMPPDIAARLDDALAGARAGASTVVPLSGRRRRWRSGPTAAGAAAVAAAVALIAAIVIGTTSHDGGGSSHTTSNPAAGVADGAGGAAITFPVTASGQVYTTANTGQLAAALAQSTHATATYSAPVKRAPASPSAREDRMAARVPATLRPLFDNPRALLACVAALDRGGPATLPKAVDLARFTDPTRHLRAVPAMVIVLPNFAPGEDGAFVVGPNCATAPDNQLYYFHKVPAGG